MGEGAGVFVGIGANLGDREKTLRLSVEQLHARPDVRVVGASPVYESAPVGVTDQPEFLNAVLKVETRLSARDFLDWLLHVEKQFGRVREKKWGPRTLDLDILLFDQQVIDEPGLQVPHPYMLKRGFVMAPLFDLAPQAVHPAFLKTVAELIAGMDLEVGLRRRDEIDLMFCGE